MRTRYAAYGLCVTDGRLLLTQLWDQDPNAGMWTLPGGGMRFREEPEAAMLRELREETGLEGAESRLLGIDTEVFPPWAGEDELHAVRFVFAVIAHGEPVVTERDRSTVDARWVNFDDLDSVSVVSLVPRALALL